MASKPFRPPLLKQLPKTYDDSGPLAKRRRLTDDAVQVTKSKAGNVTNPIVLSPTRSPLSRLANPVTAQQVGESTLGEGEGFYNVLW